MRHRRAATVLGGAALVLGGLAPTTLVAAEAPVPPPLEVERVDPQRPELVITPAVTAVAPDPDGTVLVEHRIVNGTPDELVLRLDVRPAGPDRATPDGDADQDEEVELDAEVHLTGHEVQLAPSEAATVASLARGVRTGVAYAVVAEVVGADPPATVSSVVLASAGPTEVGIGAVSLTAERLLVPVEVARGPTLVDAAVRLRTWWGRAVVDAAHADLIAWDERGVELAYSLEGVVMPGPYEVEVVAAAGGAEVRSATTRWLFPAPAVVAVATALVVITLAAVVVVVVRRRRRGGAPAES